ncbi:MAG TPA: DEAD/DEAH box helicase [Streptosporangiaceae bacterium]|nr:DEAD/DEAH box helicase [Streptosporangiaceae bacterium]
MLDEEQFAADPSAYSADDGAGVRRILDQGVASGRLTHVERLPERQGKRVPWPGWVPADVMKAFAQVGIPGPWEHQAQAADLAHAGRNVIMATGTASGKSVGYLVPALAAITEGATALYLAPTRALAADQLALLRSLSQYLRPSLRAAVVDSDTSAAERMRARKHATYLLTTPDMLHYGLLPQHRRWDGFFRKLRYVIVDECHGYRGVFGSHVAQVLRRLRRVAEHHGTTGQLRFILASATISEPERCAELLTGLNVDAITADAAPRGPMTFGMWEPPLTGLRGEAGAPLRRSAVAEAADLLADLVLDGTPSLAFIRSRRGAETAAAVAKTKLAEAGAADLVQRVAAYRSGYLPTERRELEQALRSGAITALAATPALELGVNIAGLDAVLIAGWPGTRAALWQQAGRAGRAGRDSVAILIARDDPLDTYLVHHPEVLLHRPVEATVLDPANPYILAPHLCAAAAELPLRASDLALFGQAARGVVGDLVRAGTLRERAGLWHLAGLRRGPLTGLRGAGGLTVRIVEEATGRLIGTMDEPSAHVLAHAGAVYPHQGELYLVKQLDLDEGVALVEAGDPGYVTSARDLTEIEIAAEHRRTDWGGAAVHFGEVLVRRQVVAFTRRKPDTGQPIGDEALHLPPRALRTRAVWLTISPRQREDLAAAGVHLAGAAHAAEHAAIGLLPLVAACDRWDVGGVSMDIHSQTGRLTIFVYDGHDGGAGFAERGFLAAAQWLRSTSLAIADCECTAGCPSCIQSPKCGNGNEPLSKPGSLALLECLLAGAT